MKELYYEVSWIHIGWVCVNRKFPKHMTSGLKSFRELVTGQGEVGILDLATSDFDLKEAVKKYRFAIVPKVLIVFP